MRGFSADGVDKFLGIPYAAPPVGGLRWKPPAPAARWHGTREATTLPPACAQRANTNSPRSEAEDCLYLSVYRPSRFAHRLPVLFRIHGGGLNTGSGNQHDGSLMVQRNGIVVVSINSRLGVFGFLALPSLTAESGSSGDYGIQDQQAALRWTVRNIAAFGGDPRNITIAGESAGGWSVVRPARLAHRRRPLPARDHPERQLREPHAGRGADERRRLRPRRGLPRSRHRRRVSARQAGRRADRHDAAGNMVTTGGPELPVAPADAVRTGRFNRVPVIIGSNHDDGRTFAQGFAGFTQQQYEGFIRAQFGARADQVLQHYPWSAYPSPYTAAYAIGAVWTDSGTIAGIGGCATQTLAQQLRQSTRTFLYQFDDRRAPGLNQNLPGYQWGAGHAMELAYMWPSFDNGIPLHPQLTPAQRRLSEEMVRRWAAFARFGLPWTLFAALWPDYRSGRLLSLRPGGRSTPITDAEYAAEHQCGFWNGG